MKGISDEAESLETFTQLEEVNQGGRFDYILIEQGVAQTDIVKKLMERLNLDGYMIVRCENRLLIEKLQLEFSKVRTMDVHMRTGNGCIGKRKLR